MTAVYRVGQALRALMAFSQPVDCDLAAEYLSPDLMILFGRMRRSEQLHGLNVLRTVLAQGQTPRELAVAALLHDVGKTRYTVRIWQKTIAVAVETLSPRLFERLSRGDAARFWLRPFAVKAQHPAWSAEMLTNAGASEVAVWLVAHHQEDVSKWADHPYHDLLQRLQQADDAN
jgi:hypothetical protein